MKNSFAILGMVATLSFGLVGSAATADGNATMTSQQISTITDNRASSSGGNWVLPVLVLIMVAAAAAGD